MQYDRNTYIVSFTGRRRGTTGVHYPQSVVKYVDKGGKNALRIEILKEYDIDSGTLKIVPYPVVARTVSVQTEYVGPTNHRGSRVKVFGWPLKKAVFVPWAAEHDSATNHALAARDVTGWSQMAQSGSPDGAGYVFTKI